jgi:hypothetical protein
MTPLERETSCWGGRRIGWRLLSDLLVRTPGFPLALAEAVAAPAAAAAVDEAAAAWDAMERVRADVPDRPGREVRAALRRLEPVAAAGENDRWAARWNTALAAARASEEAARAAHREAMDAAHDVLRRTYRDERLQEAVFLSNPGFFDGAFRAHVLADRELAGSDARRAALAAHRYLRRLCARCETTSFFGPTTFARFDPDLPDSLGLPEPAPPAVFVEASAWLVEELAARLGRRRPLAARTGRRSPLFREEAGGRLVRGLDGRALDVSPAAAALWREADGDVPLAAAADRAGVAAGELAALVRELGPALLHASVEVPATELRPLSRLAAAEDGDPGLATELAALRDRFAAAPWPERRSVFREAERVVAEAGVEPNRHAGAHYADRSILHEDRSGPEAGARLGLPAIEAVQDALAACLPLCLLGALLRREDAREAVRTALESRPAPFLRAVALPLPDVSRRADALRATLADLVRARARGGLALLTADEVRAAAEPLWELVPDAAEVSGCLPSPDLMADGEDLATALWVLSELHDDCSSTYGGFTAPLHPDPPALWARFLDDVRATVDPAGMACVVGRRRMKHVTPELPGLSIELSGRSSRPRTETVPAATVEVAASATHLSCAGSGRRLYPGDVGSPLYTALALPALAPVLVELGEATPRIQIGRLVYQRARWVFDLELPGTGFDLWRAAQRLRRDRGLPRRVFLRHPAEPKPLYLDFADPLAVEDLRLLPAARVVVTEMLPAVRGWWAPAGRQQQAELRLGCCLRFGPT